LVPVNVADGVAINVSEKDALLWYIAKEIKVSDEEKVPINIEGYTVNVPPIAAAMVEMKKLERDSKNADLEKEVLSLRERNTTLTKQIEGAINGKTSMSATGQTLTDVIDKRMGEGHDLIKTFINRLPMPGEEGGELEYKAERSIDDRRKLAMKIEQKLEKGVKEIDDENALLEVLKK